MVCEEISVRKYQVLNETSGGWRVRDKAGVSRPGTLQNSPVYLEP